MLRQPMHVLLIDDDPKVSGMVARYLQRHGVEVKMVHDGETGVAAAGANVFDAILLDIRMPGLDGFETLDKLRATGVSTPVLFLTGSDSTENLVRALEGGGDDFIEKPFQPEELLARLRAVVRRAAQGAEAGDSRTVRFEDLEIDTLQHRASWNNEPLDLTRTELRLLHALALADGEIVSRDDLWRAGWGDDAPDGSETLGVHVSNLRKRLAAVGAESLVVTIRGRGYRLRR